MTAVKKKSLNLVAQFLLRRLFFFINLDTSSARGFARYRNIANENIVIYFLNHRIIAVNKPKTNIENGRAEFELLRD